MSIELKGVRKRYGSVEVVKGVDITVEDGQFLVLLGPSGCGKTTLLRMMAGLETVTEGKVYISGEDVTDVLPKYRDIAMVFQSYALYPHMTVADNIGYPLLLRKTPNDVKQEAILDAAKKVHLDPYLDRYPRQLSGGQRQRVALARAMVRRPRLFLMDEPLSNLDAKLRGHMRAELKHLQKKLGVTTVYVTHDQIEAMTLADKVAVIHNGVIQQLDTPRNIYNEPANLFVAGFVGSPQMNMIRGSINQGRFTSPAANVSCENMLDHSNAVMGVRPEDLTIVPAGEEHTKGKIKARIYSLELTGDETIVTCSIEDKVDQAQIVVRMSPDYEEQIDAPVEIALTSERIFFFDDEQGNRLFTTAKENKHQAMADMSATS